MNVHKGRLLTTDEWRSECDEHGRATGLILLGASPRQIKLWNRALLEQGMPSAPNRRQRRAGARAKRARAAQ